MSLSLSLSQDLIVVRVLVPKIFIPFCSSTTHAACLAHRTILNLITQISLLQTRKIYFP